MQRPNILTPPPGPEAAKWIARDDAIVSPSLPREYPLVLAEADGVWAKDPDGNTFLDFTSGIAVCNTGHCHAEVVSAAQRQLERLIHTCGADFYHPGMIEVAEALARITPGEHSKKVFLGNSGAEAVEAGLKLSRHHSGRWQILSFIGAFHGRSMGALSLTASKAVQKKGFGPFVPGITHIPYAYCYRCAYNLAYPDCNLACVDYLESQLFEAVLPPEEVAIIIVEPIQGEGGYIVPPLDFHQKLQSVAQKYGILYMADEIQAGMGRTGRMFALEHFGIVPDLMSVAKGVASGLPLSALIARADVMDWERGAHGSTFGGNPVSCAAALATIEIIESKLVENAARRGQELAQELGQLQDRFEAIGDVRGMGMMQAVELVEDRETKKPDKALRDRLLKACFKKGLLLLSCGQSTIRFCPPLVATAQNVRVACEIFGETLQELQG
jgi:4-aminobutyrate aminotransferase